GSGIDPRHLTRATGVPVIAEMADQRGLAEAIDLGLGPVRSPRGQLGRAAADVLQRVSVMGHAA
ncbi:MAG: septum site determining protein, partial [Nocardioides sp.]